MGGPTAPHVDGRAVTELGSPIAFSAGWQARGELAAGVVRLTTDMLEAEGALIARERKRRPADAAAFARAVEAITCNLAIAHAAAPGRAVAIQRGKAARRACFEYGAPFNLAADLLHGMGLATQSVGRKGTASTLTATAPLLTYLPRKLLPAHLAMATTADVLELRASKAEWRASRMVLAVPNTAEAAKLRQEMHAVAEWLNAAPLTFDGPQFWLAEREGRLARLIALHGGHLRRVFNNGSLEHGGRIFGGWWQSLPAAERLARIRIAGERVLELDFRAMVPRLCYARLGVPWHFVAGECPYKAGAGSRAAWKKLTNAMLAAGGPLRSWPGETVEAQHALRDALAIPLSTATKAVRQHHPALAEAGGFGRHLSTMAMRAESDVAVQVVLSLRERGIVVLPNHDGFLVPASKMLLVAAVMREVALARVGADLHVTVKEPA